MEDAETERVVAEALATWASPLERTLFGTDDPSRIVRLLAGFCATSLGADLASVRFYRRGVGCVFGVELTDGRAVVVKVHRRELIGDRLLAIRRVQRHVADAGLPAPRPLGEPRALGGGLAAAEELLDGGPSVSAHDPDVRRALAVGLHRFVEVATPLLPGIEGLSWEHPFDLPIDRVWPIPHDLRFDLGVPGGEWIDAIAADALAASRDPAGRVVIGHVDWRVENVRVNGDVTAVFDWDSVAISPEPWLVGGNAAVFTAEWSEGLADPYPTLEEIRAFIEEYEAARDSPFTPNERATADAAIRYRLAYCARCEFSDDALGIFPDGQPPDGWRRTLRSTIGRGG